MTSSAQVPGVSVVICTWNRSELLARTLEAMTSLRIPEGLEWELLVVNNNCTDDTDRVIESFGSRLPVRRLFEESQGLSNARNHALSVASGDLVVWTDDDVLVEPEWLVEHMRAAVAYPDAPFFGGPVEPWFEVEPADWIERNLDVMRGAFAIRRLGNDVRPFRPGEEPFGANMMIRRRALADSLFDPQLGRLGSHMLSGEETALFDRLRRESADPGVWVGSATVRHFVPAERMSIGYLRDYWRGLGRSRVRQDGLPEGQYWRSAPRWAWRRWFQAAVVAALLSPWKTPAWARATRTTSYYRGMIEECRRIQNG